MRTLPSANSMYRAVMSRDSSFEGVFLVGVKTTGIFCRPTCGAKKPKRENVEFFRSVDDALYAGYRPCKRCNPINQLKEPPTAVLRLRELVEESPARRITGHVLRQLGVYPSTARRQFHKYHGMTFHAYQRARRMGIALREVRNGESVIGAQLNQGFESASGFWNAFRRVFGSPPSKSGEVHCLLARWIDTPLGAMLAVADDDGLRLLEFVDRRALEREIKALMRRMKSVVVPGDNRHLQRIADELREYFEGKRMTFTVPVRPQGSEFDSKVWSQLQRIKPGETWSYAALAQRVGNPAAHRAVAQANGRNSLAIVVPCHRVIRSDGTLSGYGGGVWRKQWLLEHERRMLLRRNAS